MLSEFIVAHCDKDLSVIVISGSPTPKQLQAAWDRLYEQYIKAVAGNEFSDRLQVVKDYTLLESKVRRATMLLELYKVEEAREMIAKMITNFKYPIGRVSVDNLNSCLKRFQAYLKTDIVKLNGMAKKLETKEKKAKEPKVEDYYNMLGAIAEALKIQVNPNTTSVAMYCTYVSMYNRHVEQLIKQQNK